MPTANSTYGWKDRLADLTSRPYRLALWTVLFGLAFALGRFWLLLFIIIFAFARGIRLRKTGGGLMAGTVGIASLIFFILHFISFSYSNQVEGFFNDHTPVDISNMADGTYFGQGNGNNGVIKVAVKVAHGRIEKVDLLQYSEPVYAFDDILEKLKGQTSTDLEEVGGYVFRNRESLLGLMGAVENALLSSLEEYPEKNRLMEATFLITSNTLGRILINTLAILFIAIVSFDFFLQPTLARGTGQSLNCYNCQACVGACPVKMVAGDPFPMIMVIEARAGNYDKVAQLAKYCVGCGKCAAKCPIGNSGPAIASSSYRIWKEGINRENRREKSLLSCSPTIDQLSQEQSDEK